MILSPNFKAFKRRYFKGRNLVMTVLVARDKPYIMEIAVLPDRPSPYPPDPIDDDEDDDSGVDWKPLPYMKRKRKVHRPLYFG